MVLLFVIALTVSPALALNDTPESAIVLTPTFAGTSTQLVGDSGGRVQFYRVNYAGNGNPVRIELTSQPGRNNTGEGFGFKVYGPNGLIGEAPVQYNESTWTRYSMTITSTVAGVYLIQVYNYNQGQAVDYNIQATGLETATTEGTPTTSAVPAASTSDNPVGLYESTSNVGGTLVGKADGAHQYYTVEYPGGFTSMNISVKYSPPTQFQNNAFAFNVYRGTKLIAQGLEVARDGTSATAGCTISDEIGGPLLVQISNYQEGLQANFVLSVTGGAGQAYQAGINTSPDKAIVLTGAHPAARGDILPGTEASHHFYLVNYPGGNREVKFFLTVDDVPGAFAARNLGFNIYKGADLVGHVDASLSSTGDKWIASYTLVASDATTYGIQLFDYSTAGKAHYSFYSTNLP
jgi:hypothetical protein